MDKKYFTELAAAYEAEAKELERGAVNAAQAAIAAIEAGELDEAMRLLADAANSARGAAIDRAGQREAEGMAAKAAA